MSETTNQRDVFVERLSDIINPEFIETFDSDPDKVYLFPASGGYGITEDMYEGLDARLIESIGMSGLNESHRLYRERAHHVLIFKVE